MAAIREIIEGDLQTEYNSSEHQTEASNVVDKSWWYYLCRICARRNDYLIPIFKDDGIKHELPMKISKYFPFEISQDDGLPQQCCHECVSLVISWDDLIHCSQKANEKLNNLHYYYTHEDVPVKEERGDSDETVQSTFNDESVTVSGNDCFDVILSEPSSEKETREEYVLNADENTETNFGYSNDTNLLELSKRNDEDNIQEPETVACESGSIFYLKNDEDHITTIQKEAIDVDNKSKKERVLPELQAYKLHQPLKYIVVKGQLYLRTKVFGFEIESTPESCDDKFSLHFSCCICNETLRKEDVVNHSKTHYPLKITDTCKKCHFGFSSVEFFRNHLKRHMVLIDELYKKSDGIIEKKINKHKSYVKKLINSDDSTTCLKDKEFSVTKEKNKQESLICEYCGLVYDSRKMFLQHVKRIHVSAYVCKICKKRFSNKISLKKHRCILVIEKGPDDKVSWFNCKCKKIFLFEEQYLKHVEICEKAKYSPCQECGREFISKASLDLHILLQHMRLKELEERSLSDWICEICGCELSSVSARKHYLTHSFLEKKFTCDVCEMKFIDKSSLNKHSHTHSDIRPFNCNLCNATFKRKDHVKLHMKSKHNISNDNREYQCRKCKRRFTTHSYLIRHQRLHSTGVSYECLVCKSRFPTEHSLKMHQTRTKHDSPKENNVASMSLSTVDWANKYRCNICNQRYGSVTSLKKHILNHSRKEKDDGVNKGQIGQNNESVEKNEINGSEDGNSENKDTKLDVVEKIYQCPKCSTRYLSEFGLKLHLLRTKHAPVDVKTKKKQKVIMENFEKNPRFKCSTCDEIFCTLLSLKMHRIKRKHFSKCQHCDKRFALDSKLRNHLIKVHNRKDLDEVNEFTVAETMPFECILCKQKFAMHHNWIAHMERKHGGHVIPVQYI